MMNVSSRAVDAGFVVEASGDVDMQSSPKMREELRKAVAQKPAKIVVNLTEVAYIDSSGLATLVECLQSTRKQKSELILVGISATVRDIFELSGLDRVFTIEDGEAEALAE